MLDDAVVEVEAADVADAFLGEHFEAGLGAAHHGRVEGAAAEVVDRQAAPGRDGGAEHGGEVGRRRHRFGDELGRGQPGQAGRVDQDRAPPLAPPRRVGQADLSGHLTGLPLGFEGDLLEDIGEHLRHRDLGGAEEHRAVVDAALRVRLEAGGVHAGVALGVASDEHAAVGVVVDRRGQDRGAVEQQRADSAVGRAQHGDGVRGSEIDSKHVHVRTPCLTTPY